MSNGMPIVVNGVMKPIPTLYKPLNSVDINTKESFKASIERSDSCAVPAASVVVENVVAFEIAKALLEEFQSNHIEQLKKQIDERRLLNIEYKLANKIYKVARLAYEIRNDLYIK